MTFEPRICRVEELINEGVLEIGDGYRAKNSELGTTGLPFARVANIKEGFDFSEVDRFPVANLDRVRGKVSRPGDVVFTSKGTVGRFAYVTEDVEPFVYSPQLCYWRSLQPEVLDPRFLYFWMQGPEFMNQVASLKSQTDMADYVNLRDQRRIVLTLPPVSVQREIASALGHLEDRIFLLRASSSTLHAVAEAIFKSWFVDFDPVRAKAEGRDPEGVDEDTAAWFPEEFQDSELGPIPKGWRVDVIDSVISCVGGSTPSTKEPAYWNPPEYHWVTPKDLSGQSTPVLLTTERMISEAGLKKISSGLLSEGTLLLSSRAPIGYLAITKIPTAINQGFIAMPPGGELSPEYMLFWSHYNLDTIKQHANGSTFMEISKAAFRKIKLVVPPAQLINRFTQIAQTMLEKIAANERYRMQLVNLRDTLLPRLICGKLRVPEAEEALKEVL